jgi:bifunctional DNA-binding transcriptional regulator/antitoxin component of YhaV-PrlF toxin-antitoxin module
MVEEIADIVTAYESGGRDSLVVAIPKRLREKLPIAKGQRFLVKVDSEGRLIYEPLKG